MNKKNWIVLMVVIVILLIVAAYFIFFTNDKGYSVVYLTSGEVYVGKLSTFPNLQLKDAFIFQVTKDATDPTKNNFQLNPISEALWAPKELYLNRDQIIFYGPLTENSKIAQTLAAQKN